VNGGHLRALRIRTINPGRVYGNELFQLWK
jgi:hypothetical protein